MRVPDVRRCVKNDRLWDGRYGSKRQQNDTQSSSARALAGAALGCCLALANPLALLKGLPQKVPVILVLLDFVNARMIPGAAPPFGIASLEILEVH